MNISNYNSEYLDWLQKIKIKIKNAQIKAAITVNTELVLLYFDIGNELYNKFELEGWGNSVVEKLESDLKSEFQDVKGFSRRNLFYMKRFYAFYCNEPTIVQQLVAQIPWGHNILIFSKSNSIDEAIYYINSTIENNWSRSVLESQMSLSLFQRQGNSTNNFSKTLPIPNSDLVNQTIKDPYIFDFLSLKKDIDEKNIEEQLTKHITKFLLELGNGFAFIGRQFKIEIGEKDFFIDLLFYHTKLKCYVVVELKANEFKPEYAGKLSFYLSAVDGVLKMKEDNPSIGILLCQKKNKIEAEYSLRGIAQPIGISEYQLSKSIPENLKSELPSIDEIEKELEQKINK